MANFSMQRTEQLERNKFHDGETNPGKARTRGPTESNAAQKVTVVYYLWRNGQLGHPHFTEVPLSSPQGLQLRDVADSVDFVQGQGMPSMYSWSFKRSYRNGFVWQDLWDTDFMSPCNGQGYILKGSPLIGTHPRFQSYETTSPSASRSASSEINCCNEDSSSSPSMQRRSLSWATFDGLVVYKNYHNKTNEELARECNDMPMQTDEERRAEVEIRPVEYEEVRASPCREEIEPPSILKSRSRASQSATNNADRMVRNGVPSVRKKAHSPLLMFLKCGSRQLQKSPESQYRGYPRTTIQFQRDLQIKEKHKIFTKPLHDTWIPRELSSIILCEQQC